MRSVSSHSLVMPSLGLLTSQDQINNNELGISLPILQKGCTFDIDKYDTSGGCTLDPFAALINHACEPNSCWVNEGTELRVRAVKDVPVGGELTFNYISTCASEFHERRASLQYNWCFDCTCQLCRSGPRRLQPAKQLLGELCDTIERVAGTSILLAPAEHQKRIQGAIKSLGDTGLGLGVWPTEKLYSILYATHVAQLKSPEMLKTYLKTYYDIQPAQNPSVMPYQRIGSLRILITLVNMDLPASFPKNINKLMASMYYHLRGKLVRDTAKCWGEDSEVARFEKVIYGEEFGEIEALAKTGKTNGRECEFIPIESHINVKRQFVRDMNKLLEWAGLKAKKTEELVSMRAPLK
jgi:hypothetical protein